MERDTDQYVLVQTQQEIGARCPCVSLRVCAFVRLCEFVHLSSFVFFMSYFRYSLHHVAFKWVSEESCSLPWATQLINSTPHTHTQRETPAEAQCVILSKLKPKGVGTTPRKGRWDFPHRGGRAKEYEDEAAGSHNGGHFFFFIP